MSRFSHPVLFFLALAGLFGLSLQSCSEDLTVYSETAEIGAGGWTYQDSIPFRFSIEDTTQVYSLSLEIGHDTEYPWQNIYVMIHTYFPDDSIKTDVLSLELTDGAGGWQGDCSKSSCRLEIPLQGRVRFPMPGEYALTFIQHMRVEMVPGVESVGLRVSRIPEPS